MARKWLNACLLIACALILSESLSAQATPQVQNPNTHGQKFASGGFGFRAFYGFDLDSAFYRATRVDIPGELPEFGEGAELERSDTAIGVQFDWQFGSSEDDVGSVVSLKLTNIAADSEDAAGNAVAVFRESIVNLGFDLIVNFSKSETIEADTRRTRNGVGVAAFFGPSINYMVGDLDDVRQLATLSFDIGMVVDIPFSNSLQLMPSAWLDINFHRNGAVDREIFQTFDSNRLADPNNPNNDGIVVRSKTLVPAWIYNIGAELVYTPVFKGEDGKPINAWRFSAALFLSQPFSFNSLQADKPSDPLHTENRGTSYATLTFTAAYTWG